MTTWKRFISYYKPYRGILFFDLFCTIVLSAVDLAYPMALKVFQGGLFTRSPEEIISKVGTIALVMIGAYIIQALAGFYINYWGHNMGAHMERDMRAELFEHYEKLSFSYYDRNNTGQMMSKLISDLFDISEMAHHGPEMIFMCVLKLVGSFICLFFVQWKLAAIMAVITAGMTIIGLKLNNRLNRIWADNRKKIGNINETLQDSFGGIRIVQAFANEDMEKHKFKEGNNAFLKSKLANYKVMGEFNLFWRFSLGLMFTVTLAGGGYFIAIGEMDLADLAMFALYINIFVRPIDMLLELTEMLQKGYSGFKRFKDVIDTEPDIVDSPDAEDIINPEGDIVYNDVSFKYQEDEDVLEDVSFTVPAGRSIAFAGPSGGGKTTICSLLPRFYDVTGGSISIGGQDIRKIKLQSLRNSIGIVQQEVYMFGGSIRENIEYGKPGASMDEIIEAAKKAKIHDFIMSLPDGYNTIAGERGARLSGGQKQRISIARVFLKNPPILIFDEATSALDNENEAYIRESLHELSKGRTTITIAHRLSTIRDVDEIFVISSHTVKEHGTHQELMAQNGKYAYYYNLQFEGL